jgi:hypothetical protein
MPTVPLTHDAVTGTHDQTAPVATPAPAPVTPGHGRPEARALLPRRDGLLRRVAGQLRPVNKSSDSYRDPLFERPDLVENDYGRFRNRAGQQSDERPRRERSLGDMGRCRWVGARYYEAEEP